MIRKKTVLNNNPLRNQTLSDNVCSQFLRICDSTVLFNKMKVALWILKRL